ncbi:hypothetical protein CNECB9_3760099 [Cupriavidus necator]|uniref:Uncharacterized protein n=1 Tax=Cupriavidus necator TaxID=106590 RepID=A0A1K0JQJ5_CUPNE|nr:hypothetical protein CNECB9_3760099 [Cupriavidus necator]
MPSASRIRYVVSGLAPARIEVSPRGWIPAITNPDLPYLTASVRKLKLIACKERLIAPDMPMLTSSTERG